MLGFEGLLPHLVLLPVVISTETDRPSIRRLEADASISSTAHMCTFYWQSLAPGDRTTMLANPRPMRRARSHFAPPWIVRNSSW